MIDEMDWLVLLYVASRIWLRMHYGHLGNIMLINGRSPRLSTSVLGFPSIDRELDSRHPAGIWQTSLSERKKGVLVQCRVTGPAGRALQVLGELINRCKVKNGIQTFYQIQHLRIMPDTRKVCLPLLSCAITLLHSRTVPISTSVWILEHGRNSGASQWQVLFICVCYNLVMARPSTCSLPRVTTLGDSFCILRPGYILHRWRLATWGIKSNCKVPPPGVWQRRNAQNNGINVLQLNPTHITDSCWVWDRCLASTFKRLFALHIQISTRLQWPTRVSS